MRKNIRSHDTVRVLTYLSKRAVQSLPAPSIMMSTPPGWKCKYGVMLNTRPRNTVHASSSEACIATSVIGIPRRGGAPLRPARFGSLCVFIIQCICEKPGLSATLLRGFPVDILFDRVWNVARSEYKVMASFNTRLSNRRSVKVYSDDRPMQECKRLLDKPMQKTNS